MKPRYLAVAALMMALTACGHAKNKDYAAMNKIPMHTLCVGRMQVDVPDDGKAEWQQQFDYAKVSKLPASIHTEKQFHDLVQNRKAVLEMPTEVHPEGSLGTYKTVGENAVILQYRDPDVDVDGYYTERFLWLGRWGYKYETGGLFNKDAADLVPRIEKTFHQVTPIDNQDPPAKAGFCIDSALVAGKIGPVTTGVSIRLKRWQGVALDANASEDDGSRSPLPWEAIGRSSSDLTPFKMLADKQSYADRSMSSGEDDRITSFDVLRKQKQTIAGLEGEQTAIKVKLANGQEYYRFDWISVNDAKRPNKTGFGLTLSAGAYQYTAKYSPPPPEKDLLALWDAVVDSLKSRHGAR